MIGQVDVFDAYRTDADAGVVDEHVEPAETKCDLAYHVDPLVVHRDIEMYILRGVTDGVGHGLARVVVDVGHDHLCAV